MWMLSLGLKIFIGIMIIKNYNTDTTKAIFWLIVMLWLLFEQHINRIIDLLNK